MEKKISRLFDYQRFARNANLQKIVDDTQRRFDEVAILLEDEHLSFAAGGRDIARELNNDDKHDEILKIDENKKDSII